MAQLSSGIKNWHWRTKGVEGWAKEWFASNLTGVEADGVAVEEVTDVEGDCELGMRKSKLVTVYDQRVSMRWAATSKDGEAVTGTLIALEVMHDMDEDEYQFEAALTAGSGAEADAFLRTAKKALANKLRTKFQQFPKDMVSTHGSDLLQDVDTPSASGSSTPAPPAPSSASTSAPSSSTPAPKASSAPTKLNTATVRASGEFQCDAETLFGFLTDATRIPAWTRNPAQMAPEVGADVSLFGGNIRGKVDAVERPKGFTMSWRAPTWPEGHFGSLETTLDQGSNSTTLSLKLSGVPIGKEDEAENNLHGFYIRGLQSIGLGLLSSSSTSTPPSSSSSRLSTKRTKRTEKKPTSVLNRWTLVNVGSFAASVGLLAAFGAALYYGPNGVGAAKK